MRVDSQLLQAEAVKPALFLLCDKQYAGANEEFLLAFEHYRHARYEEALNECLKSFESTMKVICHKRGWVFTQTDTAKSLIDLCFKHDLVPSYLQSEFTALQSVLASGVPVVRNKQAAHRRGVEARKVPSHLVRYILHQTASNILFLMEAEQNLK